MWSHNHQLSVTFKSVHIVIQPQKFANFYVESQSSVTFQDVHIFIMIINITKTMRNSGQIYVQPQYTLD